MTEIRTPEELDALLGQAGQDAEPLVVREGFRIWILTEDESGQWWAWSWREEGESANPVHAEALSLPLTLLHPLPDAPAPAAEDREALARIAALVYEDHQRYDKNDSPLTTAQKRGGTIEAIGDVLLDLDETLYDDPAALAWFAARQPAPTVSASQGMSVEAYHRHVVHEVLADLGIEVTP